MSISTDLKMLNPMNKKVLRLALPNIISNITVPLLGMVDLIIVGHLGDSSYIGAIAIGTMIFNFIYWNFGFLRMGTSGFASQAFGAGNLQEAITVLVRALAVAAIIALLLIALQLPIIDFSLWLVQGSEQIEQLAGLYFKIRIWAAPAVLGMYAIKGWFIGMQNSVLPMIIAIVINVLNIVFSLVFVYLFNMNIEGVALGTVLANYGGLLLAVFFWWKHYRHLAVHIRWRACFDIRQMGRFFKVNVDIFFRSLALVSVFSFFPIAGAKMGDTILAVNTLLLQFFTIFSYILDGFAYAAEALTGRYVGAKDLTKLKAAIAIVFRWGLVLTALFTLVFATAGSSLLSVFTDEKAVIAAAQPYYWWVLLVPVAGFSAFLWDGVFIGATASAAMLRIMLAATAAFFLLYFTLQPWLQNNALWLALIVFLALRGLLQSLASKKIYAKVLS